MRAKGRSRARFGHPSDARSGDSDGAEGRPSKPILGFGWIGVVALIVLFALIAAHVAGYDLQTAYILGLGRIIGADALLSYVATVHVWHGLRLVGSSFNLISAISTIIALRIHPERVAWWRYCLVIAWAAWHPLPWWYSQVTKPLITVLGGDPAAFVAAPWIHYGAEAIGELATAVILTIVTRSWRVGAIVALAGGVVTANAWLGYLGVIQLAVLWQAMVAAALLTWSIHHRVHQRSPTACASCGYELAATLGPTCPECGATTPMARSVVAREMRANQE